MPQPSTLSYVADLVVRRTITDAAADPTIDLIAKLEEAYPFDESVTARRIWLDALIRYSLAVDADKAKHTAA